jgi:hypothetical protein
MLRTLSILALPALVFSLSAITGCAVEDDDLAPIEVSARALTGSCSGTVGANPFAEIDSFRLVVRDADGDELYNKVAAKSGQTLTSTFVRAGSGLELSLLGSGGGKVKWFARRSGQKIVKNTTSSFDMTMMAVEAFTCLAPAAGGAANVVFPAVTSIGKGRVLITGGFGVSSKSGDNVELTSAQDSAWIFDTDTGVLREAKNNARLTTPRAAHTAIFLPKSNRVLIVGGVQKMTAAATSGPPVWKPTDGVNIPYEIFDVDTETFVKPDAGSYEFAVRRAFPNLLALADDYVVALGGAVWPSNANVEQTTYRNSNLYDPNIGTHGAFVKVFSALPLNTVRAGAATAALGSTDDGGSRVLIWGGDAENIRAEAFVESTSAGEGTFFAGYKISGDITSFAGGLYFPTLTPIGNKKGTEGQNLVQFLSVGGIRHDKKAWLAPKKEDVYLVSVDDDAKTIETTRLAGLDTGIYLHQANRTDANHVVISGGFSGFGASATFTMRTFDIQKGTFDNPPAAATFIKRGGHSSLTLTNDCVLSFGGIESYDDLTKSQSAVSDIYCPAHLLP